MAALVQHHVSRLEITIEKKVAGCFEKQIRQPVKIIFQRLFVKWNRGEPEKIVFEIIQVQLMDWRSKLPRG